MERAKFKVIVKVFFVSLQMRFPIYVSLYLCLACLLACGKKPYEVGGIAPNFTLKDTEGKPHTLQKQQGKVVLVHFWTDFCKSCKVEFPKLQEIYAELKSPDFELLAINLGQNTSISKAFKKNYEATFQMLVDEKNIMKDLYGVEVYPTNVFINPSGKIVRIIRGWVDKKQVEVIIAQNKKI